MSGGLVREVFVSRVVSDGRVTIPKRARDFLDIEVGDYVRATAWLSYYKESA